MKINYCNIVKIITTIVLMVLFVANSWFIFEYFISSKEVTSSSVKLNYVGKQTMPAILICREFPFSDVKKNMSRLKDYKNNTLSLSYDVIDIKQDYLATDSPDLERVQIYSFSRGLCEVLKYKPKAGPYEFITLEINPNNDNVNEDLQIWITEPGQEFYLHMSVWQEVPFTFKMDSKVESIDIAMKKVVWEKSKNCEPSDDYDYIECLKTEYKRISVTGTEHTFDGSANKYPDCTMPWHQSMLDDRDYNESNVKPCFGEDGYILYRLDYDFLSNGTKFRIPSCAAPCKTVSYEGRELRFNQDPISLWFGDDTSEDESSLEYDQENNETIDSETDDYQELDDSDNITNSRYVYLYFTTPDEKYYSADLVIDFPTFISSIGGNLGLFLGFSCMGVLSRLYAWIEARFMKSNDNKINDQIKISDQNGSVRNIRSAYAYAET